MSNKRFNDQNPASKDGPDSAKPGIKSSSRTKPTANPSDGMFAKGSHARGGAPSAAGGKCLPAVKCEEHTHQQPTGDLPKGI